MPRYKFIFEREYTITEGCERVIEASSLEVAQQEALRLADSFNDDCPDDVSDMGGSSSTSFTCDDGAPTTERVSDDEPTGGVPDCIDPLGHVFPLNGDGTPRAHCLHCGVEAE